MIDGGGLAWKWTRRWVLAFESRPSVSACEWPAGWPGPGRAPSAERVRGTTSALARRRVGAHNTESTKEPPRWLLCHSLIPDHRPSRVPAHSLWQRPSTVAENSQRVLPTETIKEGVWFRSCDEPPRSIALAEARSAA